MRRSVERASLRFLVPLLKYLKKYIILLVLAIVFAIGGTILSILGPTYISRMADIIGNALYGDAVDMSAVFSLMILLIILYVLAAAFSYLQAFLMTIITQNTAFNLRRDINRKINVLPLKYFDNTMIGDLLSRVTNDVDTIGMTLTQSVGTLFQAGTQFIGSFVLMMVTNPLLTLVAVGAAILGFVLLIVIMKNSQKFFVAQQAELGRLTGHAEEIYSNHNVVRIYNSEELEKNKFDSINDRLYNATWKSQFLSGIMVPIMGFAGNLGFVAVSIIGSVMAAQGTITFGVVIAFMIYIRYFTNPMEQLGRVFTQLQSTAAASKRVFEFLEEEELEDDSDKARLLDLETVQGNIEFEHVRFGYNPDRVIIKDFTASASRGQKIAIVGPTGAGKTTLVNLLMRFYEVDSGRITIDGVDMKDMSRSEVHDLFGMVLQDTWLFEGTFRENIRYSKTDATDEQVENAAKMAGIDHFIRTTSAGYDTILNEEANVSQGQKQLITIARAMVEHAPFLILDEATSSVDTRTEELIQDAMDRLMEGRTSFVIAHRLSTIKNADLILVMRDGDIIEHGSHDQLMEQKGFYADLYNSQFDTID